MENNDKTSFQYFQACSQPVAVITHTKLLVSAYLSLEGGCLQVRGTHTVCLVPREYIIMVITLPQRKRGVHLLEPVKRFKGHHYSFQTNSADSLCQLGENPCFKANFKSQMRCAYFNTCSGFKIHLNEVICRGLHHHVEHKLD